MPVYMNGRSERIKKLDGSLICDRHREDITVYNFVIAPSLRMSWKALRKFGCKYAFMWPSQHNVWFTSSFMTTSYLLDAVSHVFLHRIPGAVLDRLAVLKGERPRYLPFTFTFYIHFSLWWSVILASWPPPTSWTLSPTSSYTGYQEPFSTVWRCSRERDLGTFTIHIPSSPFRSIVIASWPTDAFFLHRIAGAVLRPVANLLLGNVFYG